MIEAGVSPINEQERDSRDGLQKLRRILVEDQNQLSQDSILERRRTN